MGAYTGQAAGDQDVVEKMKEGMMANRRGSAPTGEGQGPRVRKACGVSPDQPRNARMKLLGSS